MADEDGVGAVELFEGDDEGEFVLEGDGAKGPEEVGAFEESRGVSVGAADDEGDRACRLLPMVDLGGELAAGELLSVFVENDAEVVLGAGQEVGGFTGAVGGFDGGLLDGRETREALEVFVTTGLGVSEGGFSDGEQQPFHGCGVAG